MENQKPVQNKTAKPVIGITHGNINGISYEVLIKAFSDSRIFDFFTPVVYGSSKVASYHRKVLNREDFSFNLVKRPDFAHARRANIINITDKEIRIEIGRQTEEAAKMSILALDTAINDVTHGSIDGIVNLPVGSSAFRLAGTDFHDLDEYLLSAMKSEDIFLFLVNDDMKVGFVTGHIPFKDIPLAINKDLLVKRISQMDNSLKRDFGISSPKIAVLSLNPHCEVLNEIGAEEKEQITPAINECSEKGMQVFGPYSSDRFFEQGEYKKFDAVLALYHDQGLVPFRTLSAADGVLYYSGLPCVITQPAHDSAIKLAGKGEFCPDATRNALYLAQKIIDNQRIYDDDHSTTHLPVYSDYKEHSSPK